MLRDAVPSSVAGAVVFDRPLAPLTWLRVGGPAEALFQPSDIDDLQRFLAALPSEIPVTPLGVCSNVIVRDGGLPGAAVRLGRPFAKIETLPGGRIRTGAAVPDAQLAKRAAAEGIAGLEFLRTIPGAIGGAIRMNAGCYGKYMADVTESATLIDRRGGLRRLAAKEIGFGYRRSGLPGDAVIVEAVLRGVPGDPGEIERKMAEALCRRAESQPIGERSCGSTFRNPAGRSSTGAADDPMDLKAWKLIEDAGCRGLRLGGARISPAHANFLVNEGAASAADLERLGEFVRARVKTTSGHDLLWEIQRLGVMVPGRGRPGAQEPGG